MLAPVFAQDATLPKTLVGFFAPGMHIGITSSESGSFRVVIYSPTEFAIRTDARRLTFDELASKYESVALARDDQLKKLADSGETGTPNFSVIKPANERLCEIAYVGDDYLLVQVGGNDPYRMVYPLSKLGSIHWAGPVRLQANIRRPDSTK
jgi:hypothetical protein